MFEKRTLTMHSGASLSGLNVKVFEAFQALDAVMRSIRHVPGANGPGAWETGAYNCRKITVGTNWSLHAFGIAVDINARTNPYGRTLITDMPFAMVEAIKAMKTKDGVKVFRWGWDYRTNKDAMHYEVVASPKEMSSGLGPTKPMSFPHSRQTEQRACKGPRSSPGRKARSSRNHRSAYSGAIAHSSICSLEGLVGPDKRCPGGAR